MINFDSMFDPKTHKIDVSDTDTETIYKLLEHLNSIGYKNDLIERNMYDRNDVKYIYIDGDRIKSWLDRGSYMIERLRPITNTVHLEHNTKVHNTLRCPRYRFKVLSDEQLNILSKVLSELGIRLHISFDDICSFPCYITTYDDGTGFIHKSITVDTDHVDIDVSWIEPTLYQPKETIIIDGKEYLKDNIINTIKPI